MKTTLIIDSGNYPEHLGISRLLCAEIIRRGSTCTVMDMNQPGLQLHEKFYAIENICPDWIITFDLAGFECRNGMGDVALNRLSCRMVHLLLKQPGEKSILKEEKFNYSMYFVVATDAYRHQLENNETIAHIHTLSELPELLANKDGEKSDSVSGILQKLWNITEMSMDFTECRQL